MSAIGPKRTWHDALQMSAFGGTADIGLPQTYRYRALSVAVLIVTLCRLGAVHMAVGVVLSATFWAHIYGEPVADAHQSARHNVQSPLTAASRRRPALRAREASQNIRGS